MTAFGIERTLRQLWLRLYPWEAAWPFKFHSERRRSADAYVYTLGGLWTRRNYGQVSAWPLFQPVAQTSRRDFTPGLY